MKQNNAAEINGPLLDDATETKHSDKVVTIKTIENAGVTDGQAIVDRYARVKQDLSELQLKMTKLKNELQDIEEEAISFARDNRVSILYNKGFILQVTEQEEIKYPYSTDPRRKELEALVIQNGIWENVSIMHLAKLQKYLRDNMFDKKLINEFSGMATLVKKTKVSLICMPSESFIILQESRWTGHFYCMPLTLCR